MELQKHGSIHLNGKLLMEGTLMEIIFYNLTGKSFDDTQDHKSYLLQIEHIYSCNIEGQVTLLDAQGNELDNHQIT